jgi:hypothetical protein
MTIASLPCHLRNSVKINSYSKSNQITNLCYGSSTDPIVYHKNVISDYLVAKFGSPAPNYKRKDVQSISESVERDLHPHRFVSRLLRTIKVLSSKTGERKQTVVEVQRPPD